MSRIHYYERHWKLSGPRVLCKNQVQGYEDIGKNGKENWQPIQGTKKPSEVTCCECLQLLSIQPSRYRIIRWWHRLTMPLKEFCEHYGHWYEYPVTHSGVVFSKGIFIHRHCYTCVHCGHFYRSDEKMWDVDTSKWGYSFGSEGTCYNCKKSQTCSRSLSRKLPDGMYIASVYIKCPINDFEPRNKKSWDEDMSRLGDMMSEQ